MFLIIEFLSQRILLGPPLFFAASRFWREYQKAIPPGPFE